MTLPHFNFLGKKENRRHVRALSMEVSHLRPLEAEEEGEVFRKY